MADPRQVRLRVKEMLEEKGMSQKDLAILAGISENAVSKLVRSPAMIKFDTIASLAAALECSPGDLFVTHNLSDNSQ